MAGEFVRCPGAHTRTDTGLPHRACADEASLFSDPGAHDDSRPRTAGIPLESDMMLLTTRLHIDANGKVHIPGRDGSLEGPFQRNPKGKYDAQLSKAAVNWKDPDDVVEALFALCRKPVDNEPLKIFMALSDLDRTGSTAETGNGAEAGSWMAGVWSPVHRSSTMRRLSDKTILAWLDNGAKRSIKFAIRCCGRIRYRHVAGIDRDLADLLPPGQHPAREGG